MFPLVSGGKVSGQLLIKFATNNLDHYVSVSLPWKAHSACGGRVLHLHGLLLTCNSLHQAGDPILGAFKPA